jgi:RimJ/RimL family protein N-acetyltransferase
MAQYSSEFVVHGGVCDGAMEEERMQQQHGFLFRTYHNFPTPKVSVPPFSFQQTTNMADDKLYIQAPTETARLTLDLPTPDDDAAMGAMLSDLETMVHLRYMAKEWQNGWTPEEIVARRETHWKAMTEKQASTFYIHDKATREFAGVMGVNRINFKDRNAVVGIILRKKYWSGGYGTEAQYELLRSLFDDLKMHKVPHCGASRNVCTFYYSWS